MEMEQGIKYAVANVHDVYEATENIDAGSDKWHQNTRTFRPVLVNDVITFWSAVTGEPVEAFPFNDDYVGRLYLSYRKAKSEARSRWYPSQGLQDEAWEAAESGDDFEYLVQHNPYWKLHRGETQPSSAS